MQCNISIEGSNQIRRGELPFYEIDPGEDCSKVNAVLILEYSYALFFLHNGLRIINSNPMLVLLILLH